MSDHRAAWLSWPIQRRHTGGAPPPPPVPDSLATEGGAALANEAAVPVELSTERVPVP